MVLDRSCVSVFAVTMVVEPIQHDATHRSSIESQALLPIPRPDEMARYSGDPGSPMRAFS
jgi:hypothetical protein